MLIYTHNFKTLHKFIYTEIYENMFVCKCMYVQMYLYIHGILSNCAV